MRVHKISKLLLPLLFLALVSSCTWQDTAKFTANAAVYTAMIATGNAGDWNMNADLAGQAAEDLVDLAFECSNASSQ